MIVIATEFIPLSLLSVVSTTGCRKVASGSERILCGVMLKELLENMDRCFVRRDITEILLKTA